MRIDDLDHKEYALSCEYDLGCSKIYYQRSWQEMLDFRKENELKDIITPTLMICGACDSILGNNLKDFRLLKGASLHVFSGIGHNPPRECPNEFAQVLDNFFKHGAQTFYSIADQLIKTRKQLKSKL